MCPIIAMRRNQIIQIRVYCKANILSGTGLPGVFETPRGSMAIPAFDADGKLWSVQYVNSDGSKRFARESRKEGCFHLVGSTDPVGDLNSADAIVVAEGYATSATLNPCMPKREIL